MRFPTEYGTEVFGKYQEALPLERAVEAGAPSFGVVTKRYGKDATKFWLRYQIANTFAMIGVYDQFSVEQIRAVADDILNDEIYGQFTFAEFLSFLHRFRLGKYGKIYSTNRPNMQEFLMALQPFWRDLQAERGRAILEREQIERDRDWAEREKNKAEYYKQYLEAKAKGLFKHI